MGVTPQINTPAVNRRLDSWKDIASFFGRDKSTVRRWETERGLPVHRLPGMGRGSVYAFTDELQEWLRRPEAQQEGLAEAGSPSAVPASASADPIPKPQGRWLTWIAVGGLALAGIVVAYSYQSLRFGARANVQARGLHVPAPEAQELYLKGQYHWAKRTPTDLNKAVDYFTQSIVNDPSYAQAYVGLADCYNLLREFSVMPPDEAYPRALAAAQKAVELDDTSAGAHNSLAFATYYWNWDPVTAEHEYKRALELDPNSPQGHHWYATFLLTSGRFPEALDQIEQARKLEPSSTTIQADKGLILFDSGRKSEAFALLKQLESTDPALASTHAYLAKIYFDRKDYENFFAESRQSAQLRHDDAALAIASAAERGFGAGGLNGMRESMIPVQKEIVGRDQGSAYELAANCALAGKKEEALRYLQTAYEKRETGLLYLSRNPDFNLLHDDLVYKEITERVGEKLSNSQP